MTQICQKKPMWKKVVHIWKKSYFIDLKAELLHKFQTKVRKFRLQGYFYLKEDVLQLF